MNLNLNSITISIVSAVIGFILGYFTRMIMDKSGSSRDMKTVVLIIVCAAWLTSMVVEFINPEYHTNPMVHGLMGSIVGFFYKIDIKKKGKK